MTQCVFFEHVPCMLERLVHHGVLALEIHAGPSCLLRCCKGGIRYSLGPVFTGLHTI